MKSDADWTWELDRRIRSDARSGVKIIGAVLDGLASQSWGEDELFGVHLALEEAIMNAIKHGNAQDRRKSVHVLARASATHFYVRVTDEGFGFDPHSVPDPTLKENLEKTTGRGLMLMRHYMTEVRYNAAGNSVEMHKTRAT